MTDDRSLERAARSWIEAGPTQAPEHAVEAALRRIETTPQERDLRVPWRIPAVTILTRLAAAAGIGMLLVGGALFLLPGSGPGSGGPTPTPSPTPSPTAPPPSASPTPLTLKTYTSQRYAYSLDYPADWTVREAVRSLPAYEAPWIDSDAIDYFARTSSVPGIIVAASKVSKGTTIEEWSAGTAEATCGAPTDRETLEIGGEPGSLLTYSSCYSTFHIWAVVVHGTSAFHIVWLDSIGPPAAMASDRVLFEKVLETFTFND
jgi:hypothetical protein